MNIYNYPWAEPSCVTDQAISPPLPGLIISSDHILSDQISTFAKSVPEAGGVMLDPTQKWHSLTMENAHLLAAQHSQSTADGAGSHFLSDNHHLPSPNSHLLRLDSFRSCDIGSWVSHPVPYEYSYGDDFKVASISAASEVDGPGTAFTSPIQGQKRNASIAGFDSSPATASVESPEHGDDVNGRRRPVKRACNECRQQKVSDVLNQFVSCFLPCALCRLLWWVTAMEGKQHGKYFLSHAVTHGLIRLVVDF